ncbi:SPFH domain-containing protein [Clostridium cylindrosporum]|uniref:Membrane protease subunit, stomatin/prohibitin n=1 Tax=Clostridium cylindrosporum DSM 605 TaxID=1121307 RepID=A0A0J8G3F1_CLOCY|nr:SPFH domain-containing protein [Clostridium cylindrosporum]KMT22231.1 membrane protease subunit, stomatin/prohibitin [Clostridium cylindrosporum DSM 605]
MKEKAITAGNGGLMLLVVLFLLIVSTSSVIYGAGPGSAIFLVLGILGEVLWIFLAGGLFTLQPNESCVLILFGDYKGTVKDSGFHWTNPLYTKKKISLRSRNLNGDKLKVNDEAGNPIEIATVVVWRVEDTFKAMFDVDSYTDYVSIQSESALRHLAGLYPYDTGEDESGLSLRGSSDEVSGALQRELQERLSKAGVIVEEARISHLAYAPEIAAAMLQRQQANAIIAARQKIVEGAVTMVDMALNKLKKDNIVNLDDKEKAAMVSNLLVVLCSEKSTQPTINSGK